MKYDVLANNQSMLYGNCKTQIIPYVITWDNVVTNYHSKYLKELGVTQNIEA